MSDIEVKRELHRQLRQAVHFGRLDEIVTLLDQGADVNAPNAGGATTLTLAVKYGQYDAARLLLERGADVNAKDYYGDGRTPMDFATTGEMIDLLLSYGGDCRWGTIPAEWLHNRLNIEEIEALNAKYSGWNQWECFKVCIRPGDEVWSFAHDEFLAGRWGYAIVRDGIIIRALITALS